MNTITIELCAEDRARLDAILVALKDSKPNCHSCTETALRMMQESVAEAARAAQPAQKPATPDTGHPVDEVSPHGTPEPVTEAEPVAETEPVAEPAPEPVTKWTKEDLQAKVQALAAPGTGKREKVRDIVKSYAAKVGDIKPKYYDEVMDKLIALEKED